MRFKSFVAAVVVSIGAGLAATSVAAPLSAYGHLPNIEEVSLSPDGLKMAVILTNGEERRVAIRDLTDGSTKLLGVGSAKVRDVGWAGSNHLLITKTTTAFIPFVTAPRSEWAQTFDYNLTNGKLKSLMDDAEDALNVIAGEPMIRVVDGKPTIFVEGIHFVNGRGQHSLFSIDPETGRSKLVHPGFEDTIDWVVGPDGKPMAESEYDQQTGVWTLRLAMNPGWRTIKTIKAPLDWPELIGLGRDGASALVAEPLGEKAALREISPAAPVWGEPFRVAPFAPPLHDPASLKLIGFHALVGDEERYDFIDPADAAAWAKIERAYKGMQIRLASWSADRNRVVVRVESPTEGAFFAFVDFKRRTADMIGAAYQDLTPADISPVRAIRYQAADGLPISGYLTLPGKAEPKALPLVVLAHGGPASRDTPGFDWWAQALASRGYAVLQANFRGSGGFGEAFEVAGYGEWGRKMQTDLSDGVRDLVRQGIVDPKRVCIIGGSYGGYAALAGATLDASVYRCAASVAGPSDLRRMVAWSKSQHGVASQRYWTRFMGASDPKDPVLGQISPALHVDQVKVPILLIHGKDDTVVPLEQTLIMEKALRAAKKPVEVVIMPSEDHWLSRGETRLMMLNSVVAFLEKNNPPR